MYQEKHQLKQKQGLAGNRKFEFRKATSNALSFTYEKVTNTEKIAHRDIKPENFFPNSGDQYKVGDFGCYFKRKNITSEDICGDSSMNASISFKQMWVNGEN